MDGWKPGEQPSLSLGCSQPVRVWVWWVGGWVGGKVEEKEAVRTRCCELGVEEKAV